MQLDSARYTGEDFAAKGVNNIEQLVWSDPVHRIPKLIFRNGSEYEINCQGMTDTQRKNHKLSDYFAIACKINEIAVDKRILSGNPVEDRQRQLDLMHINAGGVTWYPNGLGTDGIHYAHNETEDGRSDTTAKYEELKALAPGVKFTHSNPANPAGNPAAPNGGANNAGGAGAPAAPGAGHGRTPFAGGLDILADVKTDAQAAVTAEADRVSNTLRAQDDEGHVQWQWEAIANELITDAKATALAQPFNNRIDAARQPGLQTAVSNELREHAFDKFKDTLTSSCHTVLKDLLEDANWRARPSADLRTEVIRQLRQEVYGAYMQDNLAAVAEPTDLTLKEWIRTELRSDTALQRLLTDDLIRGIRAARRGAVQEPREGAWWNRMNPMRLIRY